MIDSADKQTVDIFPTAPKKRGRKPTGTAQTSAERQKRYRSKKRETGESGLSNLNVWINKRAKFALQRLARHTGQEPGQLLSELIQAEEKRITQNMDKLGDEYEKYNSLLDLPPKLRKQSKFETK